MKYTLLALLILVVALPVVVYIPFVQNYAVQKTVAYLNEKSGDWEFAVDKIRIGFPLKLRVIGVDAKSKSTGSELFSIGSITTGLDEMPIFGESFLVKNFEVQDVTLGFDSLTSSLCLKGSIEKLIVKDFLIDIERNSINTGQLEFDKPNLIVALGPSEPDSLDEKTPFDWIIKVDKALATDGSLKFDMSSISLAEAVADSLQRRYFDYNHLSLSDLNLGIEDFCYNPDLIVCDILNVAAQDSCSGFELEGLKAKFLMQDTLVQVNGLDLSMPSSRLRGDLALSTNFNYVQTVLDGVLSNKDLSILSDIYIPNVKTYWPKEETCFSLSALLDNDSVNVPNLSLHIKDHLDVELECVGMSPFDNEHRVVNGKLKGVLDDADFLLSAFVDDPSKRAYQLPKGLTASLDAHHKKNYTEGNFVIKEKNAVLAEGTGNFNNETLKYKINAQTNRLRLTEFVPSTGIDGLSLHLEAEGQRFDFPGKYTRFNVTAQLDSLFYNNGQNQLDSLFDVSVNATLNDSKYFAQLTSGHPYLILDTQLEGEFAKKQVSAQGYIDLQRIDLMHMPKVMAYDNGKVSMQSDIMGSYDYGDNAFADVFIHTMTYDDGDLITPFDEIDLRLDSKIGHLEATLESGDALLDVNIDKSVKDFPELAGMILDEVNRQIDKTTLDIPSLQDKLPGMEANLTLARNNSFYHFINLFGYRFSSIDANVRNDSTLTIKANAYSFRKDATRMDTVQLRFEPHLLNKDVYDYRLHANYVAPKAQDSYDIKIEGDVHKDSLFACVNYENGKFITLYDIDASLSFAYDSLRLHLVKDPTIYSQEFSVNKDNFFEVAHFKDMGSNALALRANVVMQNPRGLNVKLLTNRKGDVVGQDVRLNITNLDLNNLSRTLETGMDVGGKLNAECYLQLFPTTLKTDYLSSISGFHIGEYKADTLHFAGDLNYADKHTDLQGKLSIDNLVKLDYLANIADSVDVNVSINKFPLPLVNAFTPNNIVMNGETTGSIRIQGADFDHSQIRGFMQMHNASVNYTDFDANIIFPEDSVRIRRNRILFRDYKLLAGNQNPVRLNGTINFNEELANPELNLTLKGEQTQIINNKKLNHKNQIVFGKIPANIDMSIKGKVSDLNVNGTLAAIEGTDINFYLTEDPLSSASKVDDLVEFVSFRQMDKVYNDELDRQYKQKNNGDGMKLDVKLNIANNAKVLVHLPTNKNDYVSLVGGGQLNLVSASNGELTMAGLYDINGGEVNYKLPVLPMSKTFQLSDQSWLSWNGQIDSPTLNLIATEQIKTSVNDDSGARVVAFDVSANLSGSLNAIDVKFDCAAPEDGAISSQLSAWTEEDRSKQAILLLIAQTYIGPGSNSAVGLASANAALNSVLNKQMEKLLSNKMKNTDIDFGINSYDANGTMRTDYSVKVSQTLFNDRVRVTVGGKLTSDGDALSGKNEARLNDLSVEYLTKEDGSSYVRLFHKTNFQNILEGEVVETGVGYVQQRSGYRFWDIFRTNKNRDKALKAQVEALKAAEQQAEQEERRKRYQREQEAASADKKPAESVESNK